MLRMFPAETTIFGKRKFFLHFLLVTLRFMCDPATIAALQLGHVLFDLTHISSENNDKRIEPLYGKDRLSST